MVKKNMYYEIKTLQRAGMSKKGIARKLSIDPKTVRKYWIMEDNDFSLYMQELRYREKEFQLYRKHGCFPWLHRKYELSRL